MKPDLKLSEKLLCLSVNPKKGGFLISAASTLGITLSGSILVELMNKGFISLKDNHVHLEKSSLQYDTVHEFFLNPIRQYGKDRKIKTWITWFNVRGRNIRKLLIRDLLHKNVLREEERRFLFIPYKKVFLMDHLFVENIGKEVADTLLGNREADEESIILAMLVMKCNLLQRILPDRQQQKTALLFMKKVPETPVIKAVQETIQLMRIPAYVASAS